MVSANPRPVRRRDVPPWRVIVVLSCMSVSASAEEKDEAKQFFDLGVAAAKRKDFPVCAKAFNEAHRRKPHSSAIYGAAQCWESDGKFLRAAQGYEEALDLGQLGAKQQEQATDRLAALLPRLAFLKVAGPPGTVVSAGSVKQAPTPAEIMVLPGHVTISARGPRGERQSLEVNAKPGQVQELVVEFEAVAAAPKLPPPAEKTTPVVTKTLGWIGVGIGAAAAITAGGFYLAAASSRDEFEDSGRRDASARESAVSSLKISRIVGVSAAVVGAVGLSLVLTAGPGVSSAKLRLVPGPAGRY